MVTKFNTMPQVSYDTRGEAIKYVLKNTEFTIWETTSVTMAICHTGQVWVLTLDGDHHGCHWQAAVRAY